MIRIFRPLVVLLAVGAALLPREVAAETAYRLLWSQDESTSPKSTAPAVDLRAELRSLGCELEPTVQTAANIKQSMAPYMENGYEIITL